MLVAILALMAAAPAGLPAGAAPGSTVSPVTVSPQTKPPPADVKLDLQGTEDDIEQLVVWPQGARQTSKNGHVTLRCQFDVHGLAESCDVAYETPQGQGFGRAALKMRHTFKLSPTLGADGPVPNGEMSLAELFALRNGRRSNKAADKKLLGQYL